MNCNCDRAWKAVAVVALTGWITVWSGYRLPAQDKATQPGALEERLDRHLEWHKSLERNMIWAKPGMIIPFQGTRREAEALEDDGWVICDGRAVTDRSADARFKGKSTPNLQGRILKAVTKQEESGALVGKHAVDTSTDGSHVHKLPAMWYARGFFGGNFSGFDTNAGKGGEVGNGNPPVQSNGNHHHSVEMDPPAYTVHFIIYIRSPKTN